MELKEELELLNENSSLNDIQKYIEKMIEIRGFDNETPQDVMLLMIEEVGELAKAIRKTTHIKNDVNKKDEHDIKGELADVFMYVLSMCRALNVNMFESFKEKELINLNRTWK